MLGAAETDAAGAEVAVLEAMKMQHVVVADQPGTVTAVRAGAGDTLWEDQVLVLLSPVEGDAAISASGFDCPTP